MLERTFALNGMSPKIDIVKRNPSKSNVQIILIIWTWDSKLVTFGTTFVHLFFFIAMYSLASLWCKGSRNFAKSPNDNV